MSELPLTYSFVLLTYNQEETVHEALIGALSQDCRPIEIVISDDSSSDNTFKIIQETIKSYTGPHKIIVNRNDQNLGLPGNLDRAHALSTGDVIIAAAGDDISLPNRCHAIMRAFETSDPLLVCSHAEVIDLNGDILSGNFHSSVFYRTTDLQVSAKSKSLYIGATGAWHRDLYSKYGSIAPDAYEDLVLGFRAALEGRVLVIKEELVKYRLGSGLTSSVHSLPDVASFSASRARSFVVGQSVMKQRIRDAKTYGLDSSSPVWRILEKALAKAKLGAAYYSTDSAAMRREAMNHPLLALHTIYYERRLKRKMVRRLVKKNVASTETG